MRGAPGGIDRDHRRPDLIEHLHAHIWPENEGLLIEAEVVRVEQHIDPATRDHVLSGWWPFQISPTVSL